MTGLFEIVRQMSWVDSFDFKLLKLKPTRMLHDTLKKMQSDGCVHWWCWHAVVRGEEYAEMMWVPSPGQPLTWTGEGSERARERFRKGTDIQYLVLERAVSILSSMEEAHDD